MKNDSDDAVRISNKNCSITDISNLTIDADPNEIITGRIQIDKCVQNNRFSIYDFSSFSSNLLTSSLLDILKWFSDRLNGQAYLIFEVFDSNVSFSTGTMAFVSNENSTFIPSIDRLKHLGICRQAANFYNMNTFEVIPEDFAINGIEQNGNCFKEIFEKFSTLLSLVYVSSASALTDNSLNVQFNGQRTITYSLQLTDLKENSMWFIIYTWVYTGGNATDKSLIAHNVISLHCKYADLLSVDTRAFESIKSNYNLYLRSNVNQYLDLKKDISKFIRDVVAQVGDYALSILNKFKANLIAIFGFLFTVVLTKVGSSRNWENIFSQDTLYVLEVVFLGSLIYLVICIVESCYKLNKASRAYDLLKENYKDVLSAEEIKEAFGSDTLMNKTKRSATIGIVVWSLIWAAILFGGIIVLERLSPNGGVWVLVRNL